MDAAVVVGGGALCFRPEVAVTTGLEVATTGAVVPVTGALVVVDVVLDDGVDEPAAIGFTPAVCAGAEVVSEVDVDVPSGDGVARRGRSLVTAGPAAAGEPSCAIHHTNPA